MPASPDPAWYATFEERWDCERLQAYGWASIDKLAAEGREVRRLTLHDGRMSLRIPGVAVERDASGQVILEVDPPNSPPVRTPLPPETWRELSGADAAIRTPPSPPRRGPGDPPVIPPLHCDTATLEVAHGGSSWRPDASECVTKDAGFAYALRVATLAIAYSPACAAVRQTQGDRELPDAPLWKLAKCGGRFEPLMFPGR